MIADLATEARALADLVDLLGQHASPSAIVGNVRRLHALCGSLIEADDAETKEMVDSIIAGIFPPGGGTPTC